MVVFSFRCFANIDGALVPSDNGYFGNSCENVSVDKWLDGTKTSLAPVFLRADCRNKSGKLLSAAIEISERLRNPPPPPPLGSLVRAMPGWLTGHNRRPGGKRDQR